MALRKSVTEVLVSCWDNTEADTVCFKVKTHQIIFRGCTYNKPLCLTNFKHTAFPHRNIFPNMEPIVIKGEVKFLLNFLNGIEKNSGLIRPENGKKKWERISAQIVLWGKCSVGSSLSVHPVILSGLGLSEKSQMSHVWLFLTVSLVLFCTCFSSKRPTQCFTLESRSLSELLHRAVHKANSGK